MTDPTGLLVAGLVLIAIAAEFFARGLDWLARAAGKSEPTARFVVAATAASAPVVAVALALGLSGFQPAALAVATGANIANVGFVLGLAAAVRPLAGQAAALRPAIGTLLAASLAVWFLARDNELSAADGIALLVAFGVVLAVLVRYTGGKNFAEPGTAPPAGEAAGWLGGVLLVVGIAGILSGGALVAGSLAEAARETGLGGLTLTLTVVAGGISVRAAAAGARQGDGDLVLAGVAGGGVVNLLLAVGTVATAKPIRVPERLIFNEVPVMGLVPLLLLPVVWNGMRVRRGDGIVFALAYAGFVVWVLGRV